MRGGRRRRVGGSLPPSLSLLRLRPSPFPFLLGVRDTRLPPWDTSSSTGATPGSSDRDRAPAASAPTGTDSSANTASTCVASASASTPRTSASLSWINSTVIIEDGLKTHRKRLAFLEELAG